MLHWCSTCSNPTVSSRCRHRGIAPPTCRWRLHFTVMPGNVTIIRIATVLWRVDLQTVCRRCRAKNYSLCHSQQTYQAGNLGHEKEGQWEKLWRWYVWPHLSIQQVTRVSIARFWKSRRDGGEQSTMSVMGPDADADADADDITLLCCPSEAVIEQDDPRWLTEEMLGQFLSPLSIPSFHPSQSFLWSHTPASSKPYWLLSYSC